VHQLSNNGSDWLYDNFSDGYTEGNLRFSCSLPGVLLHEQQPEYLAGRLFPGRFNDGRRGFHKYTTSIKTNFFGLDTETRLKIYSELLVDSEPIVFVADYGPSSPPQKR
jgi:hypothetical protein